MKRLLAMIAHPVTYYRFRLAMEQMILLHAACEFANIKDPSVWDVDRINEVLNQMLQAFHEDPHLLDGNKLVMEHLFWTRLLSRIKNLSISREGTKLVLEKYNFTTNYIDKEKPTTFDVVLTHICLIQMFGNLI